MRRWQLSSRCTAAQRRERGGYFQTALLTGNMKTEKDFRRTKKILQMSCQHVRHACTTFCGLTWLLATFFFVFPSSDVVNGIWFHFSGGFKRAELTLSAE